MIDFESERACYYWTFDSLRDLEEEQENRSFGGQVWKCDPIPTKPVVTPQAVAFDSPGEWDDAVRSYRFVDRGDGMYICQGEGFHHEAIRAETKTHTILTGTWVEPDYLSGKGTFILVIPMESA